MIDIPERSPNDFLPGKLGTNARTAAEHGIERLRHAGGIFVEAVKATRMPMAVTDPTLPGNPIVFANQSMLDITGYTMEEVLGQSPFFMNGPDTNAEDAERFQSALDEGRDIDIDTFQYGKDGRRLCLSVFCRVLRNDKGEVANHFLSYLDVTRRVQAEEEVVRYARELEQRVEERKRGEEQFRLLVQSVTDYAIYMLDADGHVSSWNAGAERIKGYSPAEIIGEHFSRFYTEEDRANGDPQRALAIAESEGRFVKEGWRVRKDGERFWASVVIDPILDDEGALIGYAKVTRDLTEREQTQRELELAREALFQSQKMDAIGQLTGGIAHDFNNLLMATLSSLELLRKRVLDDTSALRLLDNAVEGAQRGAVLTQRMLAFARRQDLKLVRVDIPTLVRGMSDLIERAIGPSLAIDVRFPLSLSAVSADFNQLEMALLNLVVNARDAMPEGGSVTIAAQEHVVNADEKDGLEPGRYVSLSVTDTGIGMDEDTRARAMEPFFTTKGVGKGTGLGLSMVHGLAAQSGGRLFLESQIGQGTTASLWLPATEAPVAAATVMADASPDASTRTLTVLAVDDDGLVLMNTVALLEDMGHTVLEAGSGDEALAIWRREPSIDLVITDQAMPRMTGVQFAQIALSERPGIPFILATGYGELPPGANAALRKLAKPFGLADLARAVAEAVPQGSESSGTAA